MSRKRRRRRDASNKTQAAGGPAPAGEVDSRDVSITIGGAQAGMFIGAAALLGLAYLFSAGKLPVPGVPELDHTASLWLVALTGLSVGGLSCLAVQGGLLAAVIARQEDGSGADAAPRTPMQRSVPVLQFLAAKTVAYAALGALLGYFGSLIPLSLQGWLMILAGVFMVIVVLQMFDVHPFFRRFAFTPPKSVQRYLRGRSKSGGRFAPFVLGALTVFIPCGVTLAMEALAIASESPLRGALIMTAFTLGTAPLFLGLGLMATQLSGTAGRVFRPAAAVLITVIAVMTMLSGARLLGFGTSLVSGETQSATLVEEPVQEAEAPGEPGEPVEPGAPAAPEGSEDSGGAAPISTAVQEATINVVTGAYQPPILQVRAGVPTKLHLAAQNAQGCIRAFVIPSLGIEELLPATGTVTVDIPALEPGRVAFSCSMGMYSGVIEVVNS